MSDTQTRILQVAERLFATQGFAATTMRQITQEANVNLAAVNYHFGSKDRLITEVFKRRLDALNGKRARRLKAVVEDNQNGAENGGTTPVQDILSAFIEPALELAGSTESGYAFVQVLARAYVEHNEALEGFLAQRYGHVMRDFAGALAQELELDEAALYWRLEFIVGALTYAMADFGSSVTGKRRHGELEDIAGQLVHFATAGLTAPTPGKAAPP